MRSKGDVLKFPTGVTIVLQQHRYWGDWLVMVLVGNAEHAQGAELLMNEHLLRKADPVSILTAQELHEIERNLEHVIEEQRHTIDDLRTTIAQGRMSAGEVHQHVKTGAFHLLRSVVP